MLLLTLTNADPFSQDFVRLLGHFIILMWSPYEWVKSVTKFLLNITLAVSKVVLYYKIWVAMK